MWPLTTTSTLTATALHSVFSFQAAAQALQNRECVRVTISFMLDLPFLKVMNTETKKTSFVSINTQLFFTCDDYSNGKYLSIRSNLFLSKVQNCEKAIEYEKISHCFFLNYLVTSKQSGIFFQKNCGLLRISKFQQKLT